MIRCLHEINGKEPFLARYMCINSFEKDGKKFEAGVVYTIEQYGMVDFGVDLRCFVSQGVHVDINNFELVHANVAYK